MGYFDSNGLTNYVKLFSFLAFYLSVTVFIGLFIGNVQNLKKNHSVMSSLSFNGHQSRKSFYETMSYQYMIGFVILICADFLSSNDDSNWMTSVSMIVIYMIFITQTYIFYIHPGYDHMLCDLHQTSQPPYNPITDGKERLKLNTHNEPYDSMYGGVQSGRTFYKSIDINKKDDFEKYLQRVFDDISINREIDEELTIDDLRYAIENEMPMDIFKLQAGEKDILLSKFIVSKTYWDNPDELASIGNITKDHVDNTADVIEAIDDIKDKEASDSFLIRKGLFGGSLMSVLSKLDVKYEFDRNIGKDDRSQKNEYHYNYMMTLFAMQFVVATVAISGGFSAVLDIFLGVQKAFKEKNPYDATEANLARFKQKRDVVLDEYIRKGENITGKVMNDVLTLRDLLSWMDMGGTTKAMRLLFKDKVKD